MIFASVLLSLLTTSSASSDDATPSGNLQSVQSPPSGRQLQSDPTKAPTYPPTISEAPTQSASPTPAPTKSYDPGYFLMYLDLYVDFAHSGTIFGLPPAYDMAVNYVMSRNREVVTGVYDKACCGADEHMPEYLALCDVPINTTNTSGSPLVLNATERDEAGAEDYYFLYYNIDTENLADSPLWNETSKTLDWCQKVALLSPESDYYGGMEVVTNWTLVSIVYDLTLEFEFDTAINLTERVNSQGSGGVDSDATVQAYQCEFSDTSGMYDPDSTPLKPNKKLSFCVSISDDEVEIDYIETMTVTQGDTSLGVIANATVLNPSITSQTYSESDDPGSFPLFPAPEIGWIVETRVPTRLLNGDIFNYTEGNTINVTGALQLKLKSGERRLVELNRGLAEDGGGGGGGGGEEEAPYQVEVRLADEDDVAPDALEFGIVSPSDSNFVGLSSVASLVVVVLAVL